MNLLRGEYMRIQDETRTSTYMIRKYIAEDGTVFNREKDCLKHERILAMSNRPASLLETISFRNLNDDGYIRLYHVSSKEDYEYILMIHEVMRSNLDSDFDKYGTGWYMFWVEDGGDSYDSYYLYNYNHYLEEAEKNLQEWKSLAEKTIAKA